MPSTDIRNVQNVTYCTGLWAIEGNAKRDLDHYLRNVAQTCRLLRGGKLLLFYEDAGIRACFARNTARFDIAFEAVHLPVTQLPAYAQSADLLAGCQAMDLTPYENHPGRGREKGVLHYERDYLGTGAEGYRKIISIWMSKTALVTDHAMPLNPFGTESFAWIDASVSRFNGYRAQWDFSKVPVEAPMLYHYANRMLLKGAGLPLNASCLMAQAPVWKRVNAAFQEALLHCQSETYAHDEETVFARVHTDQPALFRLIGANYPLKQARLQALPHSGWRTLERWRQLLGRAHSA